MKKGIEDQLKKDIALSVQKALIAHQFDSEKIHETMQFLGLVLGGLIGSIYDEDQHDAEVLKVVNYIKTGISKGLPK